jgi:RNA processing factor Prp31
MEEHETLEHHVKRVDALSALERTELEDRVVIHHADLCADPRSTLSQVVLALGVDCDESYLDMVTRAVDPKLSRSSMARRWSPKTLEAVKELCDRTPRLARYRSEIDELETV